MIFLLVIPLFHPVLLSVLLNNAKICYRQGNEGKKRHESCVIVVINKERNFDK